MSDFDSATITNALQGGFGRPLRFVESIGSTNSAALTWAHHGAPEGAVLATDHQTEGRGRWGRGWSSSPGKLLQFSLVLRPTIPLEGLGLITTALGVACADAVESTCGLETTIKWPNDVRVNGKKLAGILVESQLAGAALEVTIAGMGVNVGWTRSEIPEEIADDATSLAAELEGTGREVPSRAALLAAILLRFEELYRPLPAGAPDLVDAATRRSDVLGHEVVVGLSDDRTVEGRAVRLLPTGELELETQDGTMALAVGEIRRLRTT